MRIYTRRQDDIMAFWDERAVSCMDTSVNAGGTVIVMRMTTMAVPPRSVESQTGIHAVFQTCHLLFTQSGVENRIVKNARINIACF